MSNADRKGRTKYAGGFSALSHRVQDSPAYRDLSGNAVKLLMQLIRLHNGRNNGELFLSERTAQQAIGLSRNTVRRAFGELVDHGIIAVVQLGHFDVKLKVATVWRLTFLPWQARSQAPTHEWREWKPEQKSRAQKLNGTGAKIDPLPA